MLPLSGVLLLAAAGLKWFRFSDASPPPPYLQPFFDARWLQAGVIELELIFGVWFLSGLCLRFARIAAVVLYVLFALISLYKGLDGQTNCGCFGPVSVSPWYTLILDGTMAGLLLLTRSPLEGPRRDEGVVYVSRRWLATAVALAVLLPLPARITAYTQAPAELAEDGLIVGEGGFVVLQPEAWVGKRFPLTKHIDIDLGTPRPLGERGRGEGLSHGHWIVVFHRHGCPLCAELISAIGARTSNTEQIALVEVPPYGETHLPPGVRAGRLSESHRWFIETPHVVRLRDGIVTAVSRDWH